MATLKEIVIFLGGWTVILIALIGFIGKNLLNRMQILWQKNSQRELEALKGEIDRNNKLVSQLLSSHSATYSLASEKKVACVERYWDVVCSIRRLNRDTEVLYSILLDEEIEALYSSNEQGPQGIRKEFLIPINSNYPSVTSEVSELSLAVDKMRPFIGEKLLNLFYVYSTFIMRCTLLLIKDKDNRVCRSWKNDEPLLNSLKDVLTVKELQFVLSKRVGSYTTMISLLESKMINNISYSLTGEEAIDNSITQVERLERLIRTQQQQENSPKNTSLAAS